MSIKSADLWSKIGFFFGCALALALLTADIDSYTTTGQASLPFGLHGQVILFTVMLTMGCTFVQVAIWRMRHQRAQFRATIIEVVAELARTADKIDAKPEPKGSLTLVDGVPPDNVRAFELGRKVERANGHGPSAPTLLP